MQIEYYRNLKDKIVVVGGDHHAQAMLDIIEGYLREHGFRFERVPYSEAKRDYIDQTTAVAEKISRDPGSYCGIIGCKNGFGVTTVANIYKNIFATRCDTPQEAIDSRRVNYSNVLTFGAVFVDEPTIKIILDKWFETDFELNDKNRDRLRRLFALMKG